MEFYNHRNIRKLLDRAFNLQELKDFCLDANEFKPFLTNWGSVGKRDFIREMILFAERMNKMPNLLQGVKEVREEKYRAYKPYYTELAEGVVANEKPIIENLKEFFGLDEDDPQVIIYLSRHATVTRFPHLTNFSGENDILPILRAIEEYQQHEITLVKEHEKHEDSVDKFTVVSAIEMLEALYLKDELEQSRLRDLFPEDIREELLNTKTIKTKLGVCPKPDNYEELLGNDTAIFIGGPRSNFGTYFFLYGFRGKAGSVRSRRIQKNVIEYIDQPSLLLKCDDNYNLAVIQKHRIDELNKVVFYLAGTGANGTAASVAYLRKNWLRLHDENKSNFFEIIQVPRRQVESEDITKYGPEYWTDVNIDRIYFP